MSLTLRVAAQPRLAFGSSPSQLPFFAATLSLCSLCTGLAANAQVTSNSGGSRTPAPHYHHTTVKIPHDLTLDRTRLMVTDLAAAGNGGNSVRLQTYLRNAGFSVTTLQNQFSVYWYIDTPASVQNYNAARYEKFVAQLVAGMHSVYVSPLFLDASGTTIGITPDLMIRFRPGTVPGIINPVLHGIASDENTSLMTADFPDEPDLSTAPGADIPGVVVGSTSAGLAGEHRFFLRRCRTRNGFEVLASANQLASLPSTEMAEPNRVYTNSFQDPTNPSAPNPGPTGGGGGGGSTGINNIFSADMPDNNKFYDGTLWHLYDPNHSPDYSINARKAWGYTLGSPSILIAGMDDCFMQHPDINMLSAGWVTTNVPSTYQTQQIPSHGSTWHGVGTMGLMTSK